MRNDDNHKLTVASNQSKPDTIIERSENSDHVIDNPLTLSSSHILDSSYKTWSPLHMEEPEQKTWSSSIRSSSINLSPTIRSPPGASWSQCDKNKRLNYYVNGGSQTLKVVRKHDMSPSVFLSSTLKR